ncbi:uncharacterized protein LOC134183970 isoform X3 [Corticium candelabrum]|nr:uncharacterized protein LOC134183970 isoform X3 [Corticium candelabrum]
MPAMHSRAIDCVRSDMINDLGQITDQMYEAIFGWDLCITVLTYLNPNVFYELALRQCVGLPVICLVEKNVCLPFDVADLRVIEYTLKPSLLFKGLYSEQLVDAVDYLIDQKWKTKYSFAKFRPSICSAPCYYSDVQDFLHDGANDYEMSPAWTDLVKQANHLDMMGITLKHWKRFEDEVKAAAARCCHVRLLILDKDNDSLASFASCQGKQLEAFRLMLDHMYSFFGTMAGTSNYITLRKVTKGSMNFGCALTDKELVYQPWFYDFSKVDETPLFHTDAKSPLYRVVSDDFNLLWKLNEASDSSMVVDLEDSLTN